MYIGLLEDKDRKVKYIAYKHLGKFLVTMKGIQIDTWFLKLFVSIPHLDKSKELMYQCAFNFPGIIHIFGAEVWNELSEHYGKLAKLSDQWVKRTLAYSLHEMAKMLGNTITETELLPVAMWYLNDSDSEIW